MTDWKEFPANIDAYYSMRDFIIENLKEPNLDESIINRLEIGFEEPLINIISYAYEVPGKVWLRVDKDAKKQNFIIEIMDYGVPFNPLTKEDSRPSEDTPLKDRKAGGYGIYFMKGVFKDIFYERRVADGKIGEEIKGEVNFLRLSFYYGHG